MRFVRLSFGREVGAACPVPVGSVADAANGEDGVLESRFDRAGDRAGGAAGASGLILFRHWVSFSAAVSALSTIGLSANSRRGGREPSCEPPSPHAGEFRLKLGPSRLIGRLISDRGGPEGVGAVGCRGPLRSQLAKSLTFPSPCSKGRRPPRSLPASEMLSKLRELSKVRGAPKPPRSDTRRWFGRSGSGPLRVQSLISRPSGRSFSIQMMSSWQVLYAPAKE